MPFAEAAKKKCFYPSYQVLIDWNGDIFLCPQDWQRRVTMGNMLQESLFEIWTGKIITKFRKRLLDGKRDCTPCNKCNAEGTMLGKDHAKAWASLSRKIIAKSASPGRRKLLREVRAAFFSARRFAGAGGCWKATG